MLRFIFKRFFYSIFIILGVTLLTFVLFRLAAGDPAAAVLGKNPSPREVEDLRGELGSDLPLLFGWWRGTEAFTSVNFEQTRSFPGVKLPENARVGDGKIAFAAGNMSFKRNFSIGQVKQQCRIAFQGSFSCDGQIYRSDDGWSEADIPVDAAQPVVTIAVKDSVKISNISFFRRQRSPFNSQFVRSLGEICSFSSSFPYVSFFNFGRTVITREPVRKILWRGVGPSMCLMTPIFVGELILGIALALVAAACKGSWVDRGIVLLSIAGMSISYLVFIIFGQWFLGYYFNWFPVWGWGGVKHIFLPVIIGIFSGLGGGVRFYRTVFVNELNREYLRTAAAKGCSPFKIYSSHLLRNAAVPVITRATAALPFLFTGSLLLETFFGVPGLGYAGIDALNNSDLQLLKALVIISAMLFVAMNLLADIAYAWADPRIRPAK